MCTKAALRKLMKSHDCYSQAYKKYVSMNQASSFIAAQKLLSFAGFLRYITFQIFLQNYILNYRNIYMHFLLNPLSASSSLSLSPYSSISLSLFFSHPTSSLMLILSFPSFFCSRSFPLCSLSLSPPLSQFSP